MNGDGASCRARGTSLGTTRAIRGRDALRFVAKRILWATFAGQLTTSICVRGKATEEENRGRKQRKKTEEENRGRTKTCSARLQKMLHCLLRSYPGTVQLYIHYRPHLLRQIFRVRTYHRVYPRRWSSCSPADRHCNCRRHRLFPWDK